MADASYVNLAAYQDPAGMIADLSDRMTPTQAAFIADNFEVISSIDTKNNQGQIAIN